MAQYVLKKLIYISGTQLGTLLSFEPNKDNKTRLFEYILRLKVQCPDAYAGFCRYKTAKGAALSKWRFLSSYQPYAPQKIGD